MTVNLPKEWPCSKSGYYDAVRIFLFTVNVTEFHKRLAQHNQDIDVTIPYRAG